MRYAFSVSLFLIIAGLSRPMKAAEPLQAAQSFNVKAFGAIGDGKADDTKAFLDCFTAATNVSGGVSITIPYGVYSITRPISVEINKATTVAITGITKNNQLPLIKSDKFITILEIFAHYQAPRGSVNISNISIQGNNPPYSGNHPYFDKPQSVAGIRIMNMKRAKISNCTIKNIYGEGIMVVYSDYNSKLENRFDFVEISGNSILNCWGLHPTKSPSGAFDDYGDGIYLSNAKSGLISNNKVINNLQQTKQFGRAGLVVEFRCEDCRIEKNFISGYDRNMHLEGDLGGHVINNNTLQGSDFGILFFNGRVENMGKPVTITNNNISNAGFVYTNNLKMIRSSEERCLLSFVAMNNARAGSIISGNTFTAYPQFSYTHSYLVRIGIGEVQLNNNKFVNKFPASQQKLIYFAEQNINVNNNTFDNLRMVLPNGANKIQESKGNLLLNNATSNFKIQ